MKDLTFEHRQALKVSEYILGEQGSYLDNETITEAIITVYNPKEKG